MKMLNQVKITFAGRSVNEGFARAALAAFLVQLDPTVPQLADMKTAVSEAVTNCIVHAYPDKIGPITMTAAIYEGGIVRITITDRGVGIPDIAKAMEPMFTTGDAEERAIRQRRGAGEDSEHQDRKVKGRVTVSFSLTDPVRTSRYLAVPAYKCEGGGEVVVEITVNRAGDVTNARVVEGGDECMRSSALGSARRSRFNIDDSAPARQQGTITYIFIPQ